MLKSVPEINEVIGNENRDVKEDRVLWSIFTKLMSIDRETISTTLSRLITRLNMEKEV